VKADVRLPILFAVILGLLMSARVVFSLQKRRKISPSKISPKGDARPLNP